MVNHNRRHAQLFNAADANKATPYLLNGALVIAVVLYVIAGAFAIRHIEATKTGILTKAERILEHAGKYKFSDDRSILNDGDIIQRVKRKPPLQRSRRCVQGVLRKLSSGSAACKEIEFDMNLLEELNDCYKEDLKKRLRRTSPTSTTNVTSLSSKKAVEEWEYWSIKDSILFCFTVITTIGYGNVAPQSIKGQLFVILYGLIGVPFCMLVIANLGKFLAELLKRANRNLWKAFKHVLCGRRGHSSKKALLTKMDENGNEVEEEETESTFGLFFAFIVYIVVGSIVISCYEPEMDFFKAIYFNFITLTTIGLGDVIPQSGQHLPFTLCYVALGLALTTIAIEIAANYLRRLHYFGRKLENAGSVKIWFGAKQLTMSQLVKNLGDKFNLEISDIENLDLEKFVTDAIKVEAGELSTLRDPSKCRPIYITDLKYGHGKVLYIDQEAIDELSSGIYSNSERTSLTSATKDEHSELTT